MPNVYDKDKPYPERQDRPPKRSKYSVWTIVGIIIVLVFLIWILAFSYGEGQAQAAAIDLFTKGSIASAVGVLTG